MYPQRSYYVLGPQATKLLGVSVKRFEPLGPLALAREFATLAFCCLSDEKRVRLTVREIRDRHPQLLQPKLDSSHYYLDNDGEKTRLAHIRVDCGGTVDHILRKCYADVRQRERYPAFAQLLGERLFLIAIVTARPEKAASIREAIQRTDIRCRFRVEIVPELAQLITRFDGV